MELFEKCKFYVDFLITVNYIDFIKIKRKEAGDVCMPRPPFPVYICKRLCSRINFPSLCKKYYVSSQKCLSHLLHVYLRF